MRLMVEERQRRGAAIQMWRELIGRTQEDVAAKLGIDVRTIQNVEAGRTWRAGTVAAIMRELGMTDADFGPEASPEAKAVIDGNWWAALPEDVQIQLLLVGHFLSNPAWDQARRQAEGDLLNEHMRARRPKG